MWSQLTGCILADPIQCGCKEVALQGRIFNQQSPMQLPDDEAVHKLYNDRKQIRWWGSGGIALKSHWNILFWQGETHPKFVFQRTCNFWDMRKVGQHAGSTESMWWSGWKMEECEQVRTCEENYGWWRKTRKKFIFSQVFHLSVPTRLLNHSFIHDS